MKINIKILRKKNMKKKRKRKSSSRSLNLSHRLSSSSSHLKIQWLSEVDASEFGISAQLLLNAQQLVVLGQTLRSAWRASLDL